MKKNQILKNKLLYKGYLTVNRYDLRVESLDARKEFTLLEHREMVHTPDSVLVLIYSPNSDNLVFCQQFRTGVFCHSDHDNPFILECVAGTIEKDCSAEETVIREVREETGLTLDKIHPIAVVYKSPGIMTEKNHIFYAETSENLIESLHGLEGEEIMTRIIQRQQVYQLMDEQQFVDASTLLALNWFRWQKPDAII